MKTNIKGGLFTTDKIRMNIGQQHSKYNKIKESAASYIGKQRGSVQTLYQFKNLLIAQLEKSINDVDDLAMDKISLTYLPFVFSIYNIPFQYAIALMVSYLGIKQQQIAKVSNISRQTIYFQAKNALFESLMYGSGYADEAYAYITDGTFKQITKAIKDASNALMNAIKKTGDKLDSWVKGLKNFFVTKSQNQKMSQVADLIYKTKALQIGQTSQIIGDDKLFRYYMSNVKLYGKLMIDFYYLINFGVKTAAYGRQVMYIPSVPSLLFQLSGGRPRVYVKKIDQIVLLSQNEFTEDFLYGLAKGMLVRQNADVISKYNADVSEQKADKQTKRQKFLKEINSFELIDQAIQREASRIANDQNYEAEKKKLEEKYQKLLQQKRKSLFNM